MEDYASRQRKPGKHLVGIGLVVVLHLLIFWAVNSGLARSFVKAIKGPVEAVLLEEQNPKFHRPRPPHRPRICLLRLLRLHRLMFRLSKCLCRRQRQPMR